MPRRDTMKMMRTAMYAILNNNLSYVLNGISTLVPVYEEKRRTTDTNALYVVFGTQQENVSPESSDETWMIESSIDLEIINRTHFEVTKDEIDNVSNQIFELLEPTRYGNGLPVQNLFQITGLEISNVVSRTFELDFSGSQTVVSKVITVTAKVVHQSQQTP